MPVVGWTSAVPWRSTRAVIELEPRAVMSKTEFEGAALARRRDRPGGTRAKPRKSKRP
jgi:hypothetical protein